MEWWHTASMAEVRSSSGVADKQWRVIKDVEATVVIIACV